MVTVAGQGDNPRYMLNIKYIYIYTLDPANSIEKVNMWVPSKNLCDDYIHSFSRQV